MRGLWQLRDPGATAPWRALGGVGAALLAGAAALASLAWLLLLPPPRRQLQDGDGAEGPASKAGGPAAAADDAEEDCSDGGEEAAVELEDLAAAAGGMGGQRSGPTATVARRRDTAPSPPADGAAATAARDGALLPGRQRIYVRTFGCAHNSSDSEFMMGLLKDYGYALALGLEDCDAMIVNSCTVKSPSQDSATNLVKRAQREGKAVVLAGCVPTADAAVGEALQGVSLLGVTQIDRVVEVVEQALQGNTVKLLGKRRALPSLDLPKVRRNDLIEIIPISGGCLGNCAYCKTKHARGKLSSYSEEVIVNRALRAASEGAREVWLTSEDTGAFGLDIGTNIASLLNKVADAMLPHGVMMKLGMTNPPYMLAHIEAVAEVLRKPNVFEFIHIPVQSGSDETLQSMVREYTAGDFRRLVDGLRAKVPGLLVATDIICGFPTESDANHERSLELIREYKFPVLNISQFYPRPGTPAAKMRRLPGDVVKRRSGEVTALFESYETYQGLVGREERAWFTETNHKHRQTVGHTKGYAKVIVAQDDGLLGRSAMVRIVAATKWHVEAEIIGEVR